MRNSWLTRMLSAQKLEFQRVRLTAVGEGSARHGSASDIDTRRSAERTSIAWV